MLPKLNRNTIELLLCDLAMPALPLSDEIATPPIDATGAVSRTCTSRNFGALEVVHKARVTDVEARHAGGPERARREIHRDKIQAAEMVEVGMAQRDVIDAHDFLRPQVRRDDSLARVKAAIGATAIDQHHARAGKSHDRAVALAHRQKRHAQVGIEEAVVCPVSRVNRQHDRQRDRASRTPSESGTLDCRRRESARAIAFRLSLPRAGRATRASGTRTRL